MSDFLKGFEDPAAVARYAENPPRYMPGYADVQRMAAILLAERVADSGTVLVLGAGGGLEMKVFAEMQSRWRFVGVDPAPEMLKLARATLGPEEARVEWVEGFIDDAPAGPFDGAASLLTLHFLPAPERLRTLRELRARLTPGAPFVAAHSSFPQAPGERETWLRRYTAFATVKGAEPAQAEQAAKAVGANLDLLDPEADADLLRQAGFRDVELFYAAFTWRGWVGLA
ncbi:MAG TPA: class I SAM-dependent methyltransferase [Croceibacterium sp.]|nr:class I SAM-dependent methyltransferase [Croceibacterium sp.]